MLNNKFDFTWVVILLMPLLCCKQQPVFSQKIKIYDLVKDFKAKADDKTDNYYAFAKAAETISKAGGGQLNIPKGKYYIAAYKITGGQKKNNIDDIIFKNCKNLTITGNNSVIRVNGNFYRSRDTQIPGLPYHYAYTSTVCPFKLVNCQNVLLKDVTINGEVDKMRKQDGVYEGISYGVFISDDEPTDISSKIVLQNLTTHHFAADGLIIKSNGEDITVINCNSHHNARQGLSIVKGSNIKVLNSVFDSTGKTGGAYGWHGPGAGIDVENEFGPGKLNNVLIRNCMLRGNNGFQIVSNIPTDKVVIDSCFISDSNSGYSDPLNGVGVFSVNSVISNCILFAGIQVEVADQIYKGPSIFEIRNNIIYSGTRGILSADFFRPINITDNILVMLPKPVPGNYFPYIQNVSCTFNRNIVVIHPDGIKKEPNKIISLVQFVKEATDDFWLVNEYEEALQKKETPSFFTAMNETKNIRRQFCSPGARVAMTKFFQIDSLPALQAKAILSKELFTAYKQTGFNRKYLEQANATRKHTRDIVAATIK